MDGTTTKSSTPKKSIGPKINQKLTAKQNLVRETLMKDKNEIALNSKKISARKTEEVYRTLIENSPEGMVIIQENRIVFANRAGLAITGYSAEEILAFSPIALKEIIHPEDRDWARQNLERHLAGQLAPARFDVRLLRKDGTTGWVEILAYPISYQNKPALQIACLDITERKLAAEALRASLQQKELLLREIHHRVKNNMQIISSLLNLQLRNIADERVVEMFKESQRRIRSMALVHEKLCQSQDLANINFPEYVQALLAHLFQSYQINSDHIQLKMDLEDISLNIHTAIPCGLILNELVSNSLKHAFPAGKGGEIEVSLHRTPDNNFLLRIKDNGRGFPEGLDFRNTETLGMQLVTMLVNQLDGSIELERKEGTTYRIIFGELNYKQRI